MGIEHYLWISLEIKAGCCCATPSARGPAFATTGRPLYNNGKRSPKQLERVSKRSGIPHASGMSEHPPFIADLRKSYERAELNEAASNADPLKQFELG